MGCGNIPSLDCCNERPDPHGFLLSSACIGSVISEVVPECLNLKGGFFNGGFNVYCQDLTHQISFKSYSETDLSDAAVKRG